MNTSIATVQRRQEMATKACRGHGEVLHQLKAQRGDLLLQLEALDANITAREGKRMREWGAVMALQDILDDANHRPHCSFLKPCTEPPGCAFCFNDDDEENSHA